MRESCDLILDCNECLAEFDLPLNPADDSKDATYTTTRPVCPDCKSTDFSLVYEERRIKFKLGDGAETLTDVLSQLDAARDVLIDIQNNDDWEFRNATSSTIVLHHEPRDRAEYDFD